MSLRDYPIVGPPSINLPTFTSVLVAAHSPAAGEAAGMYTAALRFGVDPAVLLAVFQHESSFGKAGVARSTRSIGNLRYYPASAPYASDAGGWASYATYTLAAEDASRLLASGLYGGSSSYGTVLSFPYRWAPSSDGNDPAAYGRALSASISAWRSRSGSTATPSPTRPASPAVPKTPIGPSSSPIVVASKPAPGASTPSLPSLPPPLVPPATPGPAQTAPTARARPGVSARRSSLSPLLAGVALAGVAYLALEA